MPVILLTNHYDKLPYDSIKQEIPEGFVLRMLPKATKEALLLAAKEADYFLASGRLPIDREVLSRAVRLKMVQRTGVGTDTLDLQALKEHGIPVYINRGVNAVSVAEHTVMLLLAVLRRVHVVDAQLRRGIWNKQANGLRTRELYGKTVGIIGMGEIARRTARMLCGFGVRLLYTSRSRKDETFEKELGLTWMELPELLRQSDILILQCGLNGQTQGMIGRKELSQMKEGSILVNTARGPLVEQRALIDALDSGKLWGAGLDVFSEEPLLPDHPFLAMENVVLSPHIGGITRESFGRMMGEAMQNIALFEAGRMEELEAKRLVTG